MSKELPPLLMEALGGGKRPNQPTFYQVQRPRSRSRSRESSKSMVVVDEDAPPSASLFYQSPPKKPTLQIPQEAAQFTPTVQRSDYSSPMQSPLYPTSPMDIQQSPNSIKASPAHSSTVQSPIVSDVTTVVTCLGIPPKQIDFCMELLDSIGPIIHSIKGENYIIASFLKQESVSRVLEFDGNIFGDWVFVVKVGDVLQKMKSGVKSPSVVNTPSPVGNLHVRFDSPKNSAKSTPFANTPTVVRGTPSPFVKPSPLQQSQSIPATPSGPKPTLPQSPFERKLTPIQNPPNSILKEQDYGNEIVKPAGILSKLSDFIFGW